MSEENVTPIEVQSTENMEWVQLKNGEKIPLHIYLKSINRHSRREYLAFRKKEKARLAKRTLKRADNPNKGILPDSTLFPTKIETSILPVTQIETVLREVQTVPGI